MRKALLFLFVLAPLIALGALAPAAQMAAKIPANKGYIPPRGYICHRASTPLSMNGKLDAAAWKDAPWTEDFVDIEGDLKPKPRFRTRVKMLWDDEYFYIGAELEEPHVWGTLAKHDSHIYLDNDLEVFIDPNADNHEYYEYEINALGTDWDLFLCKPYRDGGPALDNWEIPGLKKAVHVAGTVNDPSDVDKGWSVEIAFPWKVLKEAAHVPTPPREGDQWRVNFSRVEWKHEVVDGKYRKVPETPEDNWVWSPQHVIDLHIPELWGYVQFTRKAPGQVSFVPDPTGPARYLVHQVYYAQRQFKQKQKRWATTLDELGLKDLTDPSLAAPLRMQTTDSLFEVTAQLKTGNRKVHIRQDSLVWVDR
jgi:hypothetical protein